MSASWTVRIARLVLIAGTAALYSAVLCSAVLCSAGVAGAAASPPSVSTTAASSVSTTAAHLNGAVNPNGQSTSWYFDFGTSTTYGTKTAAHGAGSGTHTSSVSTVVSGLAPSTTYHYRLVASNGTGTAFGPDMSFTTVGPPSAVTGGAGSIGTTTAALTGTIDPRGSSTTWRFEYGTTTSYGSQTSSVTAAPSFGAAGVTVSLANLAPGTTYHYRLVATSVGGSSTGSDESFTTLAAVTIQASGLRVIAGRFIELSGTVTGAAPAAPVTILAQPFGSAGLTPIATVTSGGGGTWTYLAQPRIGTVYAASANGGTSTTVAIGVQPALTLTRITGQRFATLVSAATGFAGRFVKLQRLGADGRWVTLKQARLSDRSGAVFSSRLLPAGASTIRIAFSVNQAGPGYLGGFSRRLTYTRNG